MRKTPYLYAHTIARMRPRQLAGVAERKAREFLVPRLPVDFDRYYREQVPSSIELHLDAVGENAAVLRECLAPSTRERYRERAEAAAEGTPTFLGRSLPVADGDSVDWYHDGLDELPRLWRLKLYAFQPLAAAVLGVDPATEAASDLGRRFDGWLRDWTESVEIGGPNYLRRAWTPYAVSLRLQHWSRYLAWRARTADAPVASLAETLGPELYANALFLSNHVERDVGGNHLAENGAALATAGVLLDDRRFLDAGVSVLAEVADEQFLDDGCHFERSPMYHVLTLERLLTVLDLLDRTGRSAPAVLEETAAAATGFLRSIRPPDDRIPLLNDAVYGQALPLADCLRYAEAVGVDAAGPERSGAVGAETSGYHWLRTDEGAMLVDGGPVGPPHLPGHGHSDTLGVLLWIGDRPVATDTGTFDYEGGPRRTYARGVAGHNTVQVDDAEPIALGGRFLMGPRPDPTTRFERGDVTVFEGRYEADPFDGRAYEHRRAAYAGDGWWAVWDTVAGPRSGRARSRLHLHPAVEPSVLDDDRVRLDVGDGRSATVHALGGAAVATTTGPYYPRFGVERERAIVEFSEPLRGSGSSFGFAVTTDDRGVRIDAEGSVPTALTVGEERRSLPGLRLPPR